MQLESRVSSRSLEHKCSYCDTANNPLVQNDNHQWMTTIQKWQTIVVVRWAVWGSNVENAASRNRHKSHDDM